MLVLKRRRAHPRARLTAHKRRRAVALVSTPSGSRDGKSARVEEDDPLDAAASKRPLRPRPSAQRRAPGEGQSIDHGSLWVSP